MNPDETWMDVIRRQRREERAAGRSQRFKRLAALVEVAERLTGLAYTPPALPPVGRVVDTGSHFRGQTERRIERNGEIIVVHAPCGGELAPTVWGGVR